MILYVFLSALIFINFIALLYEYINGKKMVGVLRKKEFHLQNRIDDCKMNKIKKQICLNKYNFLTYNILEVIYCLKSLN